MKSIFECQTHEVFPKVNFLQMSRFNIVNFLPPSQELLLAKLPNYK